VASDFVESAWLGILHGEAVIVFGSMSWGPAFRRLAGDGWQSQRLNRLKTGLQPGRLGLPSHNAELISGLSLSREVGRFSPSPIMGKSDVPNKSRGLRNRPEIESRFAMSASRRLQLLRSDFDPSHHRFCDLLTASPTTANPTTASSRQAAEQRQSTIER